jgi:hypothetical protein
MGVHFVDQRTFSGAIRYEDHPGIDEIATLKFGLI